jgi:branched-chain amino acid transport system permease protein
VFGVAAFWTLVAATDGLLARASEAVSWLGAQQVSAARFVLLGAVLMVLVMFRPDGVFSKREARRVA